MKKTILIVDDTPHNLRLLSKLLSDRGYRVRSALSGERALMTVQKELPDLILLDIMMPGMNGFEVCHQLKTDELTRNIPVIFISALDELVDKMTAFSVGGVDYITKPFQTEEVVARVHTHLTLQDMRRRLEEQNEELNAFAHTVAHDLKNPLSKMVTSLNLLQEYARPVLDEDLQGILRISIDSGAQMRNIINELLLLASVRRGDVQAQPLDMTDIVAQARARLSLMVDEYQAEIAVPDTWPVAHGYGPWIEEVWANYMSNGLKYGGQPPQLQLGATVQDDEMIRFWIRDNGPGLTLQAQAKLFREFTRLDNIRVEGHGLGLSIVQRIMDKLGGNVGVESNGEQGSEFYFTLPLAPTEA